jgi:hypothetical protein
MNRVKLLIVNTQTLEYELHTFDAPFLADERLFINLRPSKFIIELLYKEFLGLYVEAQTKVFSYGEKRTQKFEFNNYAFYLQKVTQ